MNGFDLVVAAVVATLLFFLKLVFDREYWWIARRVGRVLIHLSGLLLPRPERSDRVAEWLGELDEAAAGEQAAVGFALGTVFAAARSRARQGRTALRRVSRVHLPRRGRPKRSLEPVKLRVWTHNYDEDVQRALRDGWAVRETPGTSHVVLIRIDDEYHPPIMVIDRDRDPDATR